MAQEEGWKVKRQWKLRNVKGWEVWEETKEGVGKPWVEATSEALATREVSSACSLKTRQDHRSNYMPPSHLQSLIDNLEFDRSNLSPVLISLYHNNDPVALSPEYWWLTKINICFFTHGSSGQLWLLCSRLWVRFRFALHVFSVGDPSCRERS